MVLIDCSPLHGSIHSVTFLSKYSRMFVQKLNMHFSSSIGSMEIELMQLLPPNIKQEMQWGKNTYNSKMQSLTSIVLWGFTSLDLLLWLCLLFAKVLVSSFTHKQISELCCHLIHTSTFVKTFSLNSRL